MSFNNGAHVSLLHQSLRIQNSTSSLRLTTTLQSRADASTCEACRAGRHLGFCRHQPLGSSSNLLVFRRRGPRIRFLARSLAALTTNITVSATLGNLAGRVRDAPRSTSRLFALVLQNPRPFCAPYGFTKIVWLCVCRAKTHPTCQRALAASPQEFPLGERLLSPWMSCVVTWESMCAFHMRCNTHPL